MKKINLISLAALLTLVACGKDGGGSNSPQLQALEPVADGTYYTPIRPVNFHANGWFPTGQATFKVSGDQFTAKTYLDDDQAVPHRQSIHMGTRCPNAGDDTNGDTFIDYNEALAVVGPVLIPLDNDLNSQSAGAEIYPRGKSFTYTRTASLSKMNADLWAADENTGDEITKLAAGTNLGINRRVYLIHGTTMQSKFPPSLAGRGAEAAYLSLPVGCGVIETVE